MVCTQSPNILTTFLVNLFFSLWYCHCFNKVRQQRLVFKTNV